nr:hypothetical protein CFP56_50378 [Quercus suber]
MQVEQIRTADLCIKRKAQNSELVTRLCCCASRDIGKWLRFIGAIHGYCTLSDEEPEVEEFIGHEELHRFVLVGIGRWRGHATSNRNSTTDRRPGLRALAVVRIAVLCNH